MLPPCFTSPIKLGLYVFREIVTFGHLPHLWYHTSKGNEIVQNQLSKAMYGTYWV